MHMDLIHMYEMRVFMDYSAVCVCFLFICICRVEIQQPNRSDMCVDSREKKQYTNVSECVCVCDCIYLSASDQVYCCLYFARNHEYKYNKPKIY